jgi:hypothetical protein
MKRRRNYVRHADVMVVALAALLMGSAITAVALLAGRLPLKSVEAGNAADWISALAGAAAAAGTWVVGYAALQISRADRRQRDAERRDAQTRVRREESAQLFVVSSLTRRAHYLTENAIEFFQGERPLPDMTARWVLSRLMKQIDDLDTRRIPLAVLTDPEKDLVHEIDSDGDWLRSIAMDFHTELENDPNIVVADHFAVDYILETAMQIQANARKLSESIAPRRDELNEGNARLAGGR